MSNKIFKLELEFRFSLTKTFIKTDWPFFHYIPRILPIVGMVGIGCWGLNAQQKENIAFAEPAVSVNQMLQYSDPESQLSFTDILKLPEGDWEKVSAINYRYVGGTGWAYINLRTNYTQSVLMELQTHFLDSVRVWLVDKAGTVVDIPTGFSGFYNIQNPLKHRYFLADLSLEAMESYDVLIRSSTTKGFPMKFQVKFWEQAGFYNYSQISERWWALFEGMVLTIVILSFFCFIIHQKSIYFFFALYIVCFSLYAMVNDGWGRSLKFPFYEFYNPIQIGHILNLGICFFLLFSREFLVIPRDSEKWWLRISPWWFYVGLAACIVLTSYGYSTSNRMLAKTGYWSGIFLVMAIAVLWGSYIENAFRRSFRPAWLLLAAQTFLLVFFASNIILVNLNATLLSLPDMLLLRIVITVQLLLIAVGWIYRQKVIRDTQEQLAILHKEQLRAVWDAENRWQEIQIANLKMENELYQQRERLARDLHDGIGSQLTHIISRLDILSYPSSTCQNHLLRLRDFARDTNQNLRETIWILNQEEVTCSEFALRLHSFLRNLWEDQEYPQLIWHCSNQSEDTILSPEVAMHLMRLTQEAITNVIKHAEANEIHIDLGINPPKLSLAIKDDGSGFDLKQSSGGFGLLNMRKRAAEIGGRLDLKSGNFGTQIQVTIHLSA